MGTKNQPSAHDCYAKAAPDEPMFVLLGRDPCASLAVIFWCKMRLIMDAAGDAEKIEEARECAVDMEEWAISLGKRDKVFAAVKAFEAAIEAAQNVKA